MSVTRHHQGRDVGAVGIATGGAHEEVEIQGHPRAWQSLTNLIGGLPIRVHGFMLVRWRGLGSGTQDCCRPGRRAAIPGRRHVRVSSRWARRYRRINRAAAAAGRRSEGRRTVCVFLHVGRVGPPSQSSEALRSA